MRVLVTGHRGYIGSVMVPMLQAAGHVVTGLDVEFFADCLFGNEPVAVPALRRDLRDVREEDLRGFDAVIHLAGLCNDPLGDMNPEWTYEINLAGSLRLARLARDAGVTRFLQASSCSMYGAAGDQDELLTETAPLRPQTAYAVSKVRSEEGLSALASSDFSPVFLRSGTAYGASPRLRADVVLNNMVGWAWTTGVVRILSDGTPWRPLVHIEDIARAFLACLNAPRHLVHNQAFNVGVNEENYRVAEIAAIVRDVTGCRVEVAGGAQPDRRDYRVDFTKLRRTLPDFRPVWTAQRGVQQLRDQMAIHGMNREDFEGRRYIRLRQLEYLLKTGQLDRTLRWAPVAVAAGRHEQGDG